MATRVRVELLRKARSTASGTCVLCGCTETSACLPFSCSWVPGTSEKLCSAHPPGERIEAKKAITAAARELRTGRTS